MTATRRYASLGYFSGLNTVEDAVRLAPETSRTIDGYKAIYPLTEAMNVDVDNSNAVVSREGLTEKLTGTDMHSFWANVKGTLCFYVDGSALYRMYEDYTTELIVNLSSSDRVSFEEFNSRVYYTNRVDIGYIEDNVRYGIPAQTKQYKLPLPAGKFICLYKGSLYVVSGKILYVGDPLSDCYDIRHGYRIFSSDIGMILSVEDGLYVSDEQTWFVSPYQAIENDPFELRRQLVSNSRAIPYTAVRIEGNKVGGSGMKGIAGMWLSDFGICVGDNQGVVQNITEQKYTLAEYSEGSALVRDIDGVIHYITALRK